jgi:hypothetical protein
MALNLDSPLMLEKELVANESATGPEFASVRKLPGVEVIGGRGRSADLRGGSLPGR